MAKSKGKVYRFDGPVDPADGTTGLELPGVGTIWVGQTIELDDAAFEGLPSAYKFSEAKLEEGEEVDIEKGEEVGETLPPEDVQAPAEAPPT